MPSNLSLVVKDTIRRYGVPIIWLHAEGATTDLDTGAKSDLTVPQNIRRALVLQEAIVEKFTYDLSYIAAGKNFVQGGFYSEGTRAIVVLKGNLSSYTLQDRVQINNVVYRIQKAFDNPNNAFGFNLVDVK